MSSSGRDERDAIVRENLPGKNVEISIDPSPVASVIGERASERVPAT
jgi:hypothetical protein